LIAKPAGVTLAELINQNALDRRTLSALRLWGLIEGTGAKLRLSERGRLLARDKGANRAAARGGGRDSFLRLRYRPRRSEKRDDRSIGGCRLALASALQG
jgi:hypothetical protein